MKHIMIQCVLINAKFHCKTLQMLFYLLFNVGFRCHRIGTFGLPLERSTGVMFFLSNGDAGHSLNLKASN